MKSDNVELRSEADSTLFATNPLIRLGFASTTESSADDDSPTESSADLLLPLRVVLLPLRVVQMIINLGCSTKTYFSKKNKYNPQPLRVVQMMIIGKNFQT